MITLLMRYVACAPTHCHLHLGEIYFLDIICLQRYDMIKNSLVKGRYYWCYGKDADRYLRMPRPVGGELSYGNPDDMFVNRDPLTYLHSDDDNNDEDEDEDEDGHDQGQAPGYGHMGTGARSSAYPTIATPPPAEPAFDWSSWRAELQDDMEEMRDYAFETRSIGYSVHNYYSTHHPGYEGPSATLFQAMDRRSEERDERRRDRGSTRRDLRGPDGFS